MTCSKKEIFLVSRFRLKVVTMRIENLLLTAMLLKQIRFKTLICKHRIKRR